MMEQQQYLRDHRHRYEANPKYRERLEGGGMVISGESNGA